MIVDRSHPWLSHCRLLVIPSAAGRVVNQVARGTRPTLAGVGRSSRHGSRIALSGTASNGLTFGTANKYGREPRGVSFVGKFRRTGSNGTSGNVQVWFSTREAGLASGFLFFWVQSTFSNVGLNIATYTGGNYWIEYNSGYNTNDRDYVVGGVYNPAQQTLQLYVDGLFRSTNRVSSLGSPNTYDWQMWGGGPTILGYNNLAAEPAVGEIAWFAMFDRPLAVHEMRAWHRGPTHWPFLVDDPAPHEIEVVVPPTTTADSYVPELRVTPAWAPPLKGPWNWRGTIPQQTSTAAVVPAAIVPQHYAPPFSGGPVAGPWQRRGTFPTSNIAPVPPPPPPDPVDIAPQVYAPPVRFSPVVGPWNTRVAGGASSSALPTLPPPPPPSPPPPPPPPPLPGHMKPLIERDPGTPNARLRRHTEKVAEILNSLMRRGYLVETSPGEWELQLPE